MATETQNFALAGGWLSEWADTEDMLSSIQQTGGMLGGYEWYYREPYPWQWARWEKAEIELTMTEVEHLRECAKKDKALRKTLEKFTSYIKVRVDFGG